MKSDKLESLFRDKVREAEQASAPEPQWDKDAAFLRVQGLLKREETQTKRLYYRVAAVLLLGLLSSLFLNRAELTNSQELAVTTSVRPADEQPSNPVPSDQREHKSVEREPSVSPLTKANVPIKRLADRSTATHYQKVQVKEEAVDPENSPAVASVPASGAVNDSTAVTDVQLLEAAPESIKITVVLGGNTLAKRAQEKAGQTVALGKELKQKHFNKALKERGTLPIAISRVKNPLSLDTQILP